VIAYAFHPDAELEYTEAISFYESRMVGLGRSFAAAVERTVSLIREHPDAGPPAGVNRRRWLVSRFPYSIVYRLEPESVVIVAVAHQSRRPGYWRRRK